MAGLRVTRAGVVVIGMRLDRSGDDPAVATSRRGRLGGPGRRGRDPRGPARQALRTRAEFGPGYARIDKWLDSYYLAIEAVESRRWPEVLERRIALALVAHRLVGVVAFDATGDRRLLMAFPNLFENFYWYVLVRRRWAPGRALTGIGEAARVLACCCPEARAGVAPSRRRSSPVAARQGRHRQVDSAPTTSLAGDCIPDGSQPSK